MFKHLRIDGFNGYSVQFNPFFENRLAVASAANFGLVGNGRLFLLADTPQGVIVEKIFDTQDGLFDLAWSEQNENHLISASGDGSIKLWDATLDELPIMNWAEHNREVLGVNWNMIKKDLFLSCSWDKTIKIFRPDSAVSINTFMEHETCVYEACWSPVDPDTFASVSGDHSLKIWDIKAPRSSITIRAHEHEVLSLDWNKYQHGQIVTGSADRSIKVWDLRNPRQALFHLAGHQYPVRRVRCSPHHGNVIASSSYDMTVRIWDLEQIQGNPMTFVHDAHKEFAMGIDFNLYVPDLLASCAWDESVHLLTIPVLNKS